MLNKDKRSMIFSLTLGDGCLAYKSQNGSVTGKFIADHGIAQRDYVEWKASLLQEIFQRPVKTNIGHRGKSIQVQICDKRMRAWRKFCYPNGKKALNRLLKYITNPEFAIAVWLMDDGYVESSISKLADGTKKNYGARLRIFTESQPIPDHDDFIKWFTDNLGVTPKVHLYKCSRRNNQFPFLKFTQADSLVIWEKIREFVLQFRSMQYKFRHIEQIYQYKKSQCETAKS